MSSPLSEFIRQRELSEAGRTVETGPAPGLPAPAATRPRSLTEFIRQREGEAGTVPEATRGALLLADPAKADAFARDREIGRRAGLPALAIEGPQRGEFERQDALRQSLDALRDAPATARFLGDETNARLAADSVGELTYLERYWRSLKGAREQDLRQRRVTGLQRRAWAGLASDAEEEELRLLRAVETPDHGIGDWSIPEWAAKDRHLRGLFMAAGFLEQAPIAATESFGSTKEGIIASAEGAGVGGVLAFGAAAILGAPAAPLIGLLVGGGAIAGGVLSAGSAEGAGAFDAMRERGVSEPVARAVALPVGLISGAVEVGALGVQLRNVTGVRGLVRRRLMEAVERPLLQRIVTDIATAGATEALEEAVQETTQIGGDWLADVAEGRDPSVTFEAEVDGERVTLTGWDALVARVATVAVRGGQAGLVFGGATGGIQAGASLAQRATAVARARQRGEALGKLTEALAESKLAERAPDTLEAHAREAIAEHRAPEHVYVPSERFAELLQSAAPEALADLERVIPGLRDRVAEARATGADVTLPGELLPTLLRTDLGKGLVDDLRFDPGEMTPREAEAEAPVIEAEVKALLDAGDQAESGLDAIGQYRQRLETALSESGAYDPKTSARMVQIEEANLRALAERAGMTPEEAVRELGQVKLKVAAPPRRRTLRGLVLNETAPLPLGGQPAGAPEAIPARIDRRRTAALLAEVRTGRKPEQEAMAKRPILALLNRLGGVASDTRLAGELRSMGVTHKTMPGLFRKQGGVGEGDNLVRSENPLLGLLPASTGTDYADPRALLDAIRDELSGKPLRTDEQSQAIAEAEVARESMAEEVERLGLDLSRPDAELLDAIEAEALRQKAAGVPRETERELAAEGFEFFQPAADSDAVPGSTPWDADRVSEIPANWRLDDFRRQVLEEFLSVGGVLFKDRTVALYHSTTADRAKKIIGEKVLRAPPDAPESYGVYASSSPLAAGDYGDGTLVLLRVPIADLNPDDIFPGRRADYRLDTRGRTYRPRAVAPLPDDRRRERGFVFSQGGERDDARGSIAFDPELRDVTMRLGASRDLSTFLHEGGHLWLLRLEKLAKRPAASPQIVRDYAAARAWLGTAEGEAITREQNEQWARGVEAYLREGKAPSLELRELFSRFLVWLTAIYRNASQLRVELSDEIRGVMDRLVATEAQMAELERSQEITPLADEIQADLMSDAERARYEGVVSKARLKVREALTAAALAEVRASQTEAYADAERRIRAKVDEEFQVSPAITARHWLVTGEWRTSVPKPDDLVHGKLSREALVAMYGEQVRNMPTGPNGWVAKAGDESAWHPDQVAELFGFDTGHDLVTKLRGLPSREKSIDLETKARLRAEFGDKGAAAAETAADVLADIPEVAEMALVEERALTKRTGVQGSPRQVLTQIAKTMIGLQKVMDLAPHKYRAAASRAALTAAKAYAAKDYKTAQGAKRQQALGLILEKLAREAREEQESSGDYYQRVVKTGGSIWQMLGKAGSTYQQQVGFLLGRFKLHRMSNRAIEGRKSLETFLKLHAEEGWVAPVPELLRNEAFKKHWRELTVNESRALRESVEAIVQLARQAVEFKVGEERIAYDDAREQIAVSVERNIKDKRPPKAVTALARVERTELEKGVRQSFRELAAAHRKIEAIVDWMDGGDPRGPARRFVFSVLARIQHERDDLRREYATKLAKMTESFIKGREREYGTLLEVPELGMRLTRLGLMAIGANSGNESNFEKMIAGSSMYLDADTGRPANVAWSEQAVRQAHARLTKAEWEWIQGSWDLLAEYGERELAMHHRLTGVMPPRIEPRPFTVVTSDGHTLSLRGGYYPVVWDSHSARWAFEFQTQGVYEGVENASMRAITEHGWTEGRTRAIGPIELDLRVIPAHLDAVILDLTHREAILSIDRLLNSRSAEGFRERVVPLMGAEVYEQFGLALHAIARDRLTPKDGLRGLSRFLRYVRTRSTVFVLGWRATTHAIQFTGHAPAMDWLRERLPDAWQEHYVSAARKVASSPAQVARDVRAVSGEMRNRPENLDRDFRDMMSESGLVVAPTLSKHNALEFAFQELAPARRVEARAREQAMRAIALNQFYAVDLTAWTAAFNGGVSDLQMDDAEAVEFADSMVRMTQGAGGVKDQAAIQRGHEAVKLMTQYFSYTNTIWQRLLGIRDSDASVAEKSLRYFLVLSVPATIANLVGIAIGPRELPDLEDDDYWDELEFVLASGGLWDVLSMFVPMRQFVPAIRQYFGAKGGGRDENAVQRLGATVADAARVSKNEDAKAWVFDALRALGAWRGLPISDPLDRIERALEDEDATVGDRLRKLLTKERE